MPGTDSDCFVLGIENDRFKNLADKKAYKYIIICFVISLLLFGVLYLEGDYSERQIQSIKRSDEKQRYEVEVEFAYDGDTMSIQEDITVLPKDFVEEEKQVQPENFIEAFARKTIKEINSNTDGDYLLLPTKKDDVYIKWTLPQDEVPVWIFAICILLCVTIYFSRYDSLKKQKKNKINEFASELPNMILQYILMLNAGLISELAFEELIKQNCNSQNYLYCVFRNLLEKARSTNSSFVSEMYSFAMNFGNKEFLRFSTLCVEHAHSGSEFASKLEQERNGSWNSMLNAAKAKAKEAETKLCFPLMLLLIALVIICITPAMLEM